jgi:hypothetical protein
MLRDPSNLASLPADTPQERLSPQLKVSLKSGNK